MDLALTIFLGAVSFFTTYFLVIGVKKFGERRGILSIDLNKSDKPKIFPMGGIAVLGGFFISSMILVGLLGFGFDSSFADKDFVLAIILTGISLSFLGLVDDLLSVPQWLKALLPMFATIPLVVLLAYGSSVVDIPFIGEIELGILYIFVIIPLAVSGSANLSNIFAGINGLEASLSLVMYITSLFFGLYFSKVYLVYFSAIMIGSLIAFLKFNWYPAKIFPGDSGTLLFGGLIASLAIADNLESFVAILFIPHLIDLIIKLKNKLPSTGWSFEEIEGYLIAPTKNISLLQYSVSYFKRIKERDLVLFYVFVEIIFALLAVFLIIFL